MHCSVGETDISNTNSYAIVVSSQLRSLLGVMPYTFLIDSENNVIREKWRGTFDLDQLMESSCREWSHPDYRKGLNILSDFRRARAKLTADEMLKFASWFSNDNAPAKVAIVVRRQRALDFANMFSMIRECTEANQCGTRLFFSYHQAESWLLGKHYRAPLLNRAAASDVQNAALDG